jgi:CheY-like chemotaxis protein
MPHPSTILIIEDNPGDVFLMKKSFESVPVSHHLHIATDGEQALEYLYDSANGGNSKRPDLILLDLNLPKVDGREILYRIKQHEALKTIPVVMFSSSSSAKDIMSSYDLQANCYVVKPYEYEDYATIIKSIFQFWINTVRLPF